MARIVLICSTAYGGCGFIGSPNDFESEDTSDPFASEEDLFNGDVDLVLCPLCLEDHTFQITDENIVKLTNAENYEQARQMLLSA